ncbi:DMT family transporter [Methylovirgula sp. 4M-Z18]|uniref:DMT family transporter n=1 Tax=Methylovirgula sp. 4M-Z18 TaxID=2293567 RepID=UPI000E2F0BB8|nr:DMT family transporter [Methylovirgula sp. 4M-Z18]RFB78621.1 DMT family transporter [Methylovirgula sp. 4M-Z18]
MTPILFLIVVLAWGLSWYGIHLQLGPVPADTSIFLRFFFGTMVIWLWLWLAKRWQPVSWHQHLWFAALGLCLFCVNFQCFYAAEAYVPSGIVSVVFSLATVFNACNQWLFHGIRPSSRVVGGALLGTCGVGLLFADQLHLQGAQTGLGIALALAGTYCFSLGNLISRRIAAEGVSLPNAVARGMAWGSLVLACGVIVRGHGFMPEMSVQYLGALAYLALIASVVAFLAYLAVVAHIGPERAAYVTVLSPIIALLLSALLENYAWSLTAALGLVLILLGNVVIFLPLGAFQRLKAA